MSNILPYKEGCSAYPGEYVPMPEIEELLRDKGNCMTQPLINVDEFDALYKVNVSLPGIQRQDIMVLAENNILSVKVIHNDVGDLSCRSKIHEFDLNYFERQIELPEDADPEFATAEYKEGILEIHIPKIIKLTKIPPGRIVVY